ncbi:MAG: serine hydrolase [Chloroflexi bacterium]|nr:serine hydrolase [Chloroflexota bacterium]MDA1002189.1 serine hydrolase [Chloroflexota bacterium]
MPDTEVNARVAALIQQQVADGRQIGVQVCAYQGPTVVVDTVAGAMGADDARAVRPDSLFLSFSVTKGVAATAMHMLVDRGQLDLNAPVARYWPAFGAHGKDGITVAQAISHQGGLHRMPSPFRPEHITDWDAGLRRMEEGTPAYPPGTATGYHAVTWGWIVGGIVQGASGRHIKDFIAEEIAAPLGVADEMYVGTPSGLDDRLTTLDVSALGPGPEANLEAETFKAMPPPQWPYFNDMSFRMACLPSGNGHFTARALARMYAALANGGAIDRVRLVAPECIAGMQTLQTNGVDLVLGGPMRKSAGFFLGVEVNGAHGPMGPRETAFGHPGAGGSIAFCDPDVNLAVAVTVNKMAALGPGANMTLEICDLIREALDCQ